MSKELKVTIYEPSKDPRSVSRHIHPEFVPLINRGVYFNEDGSLCDDFQQLPEDLSADELIGFHTDSLPSAPNTVKADSLSSASDTVKCTDAVYPILQRQKKLQKKIDHLEKIKHRIHLKNKLKKLRKKLKWAKESEVALLSDPECCINPIPAANTSQPQNNLQRMKKPVDSKSIPETNPNRRPPNLNQKKKKKRVPPKSPANNAVSSQLPNPSRFPAFIRNPWMRKNHPKNASKWHDSSADINLDYIPIRNNNNHPRFHYNGHVPPLANSRYFSFDSC